LIELQNAVLESKITIKLYKNYEIIEIIPNISSLIYPHPTSMIGYTLVGNRRLLESLAEDNINNAFSFYCFSFKVIRYIGCMILIVN